MHVPDIRDRRGLTLAWSSRQDVADDLALHVGQAEVAAGVAVGQPRVVQAQQVEDRGVEVVDVDAVLGDVDAVLVGRAVDDPAFDAAAGQPGRERLVVVLAAVGPALLVVRGAAELGGPDDQRLVEHPARLQVA